MRIFIVFRPIISTLFQRVVYEQIWNEAKSSWAQLVSVFRTSINKVWLKDLLVKRNLLSVFPAIPRERHKKPSREQQ